MTPFVRLLRAAHWRPGKSSPGERVDARRFVITGDRHWGASITYTDRGSPRDLANFRVHGWVSPLPRVGDVLLVPMQSGRWCECVFVSVEPCGNPRDMFFATCASLERYAELPARQDRPATQLVTA
jgi:hypothetical protein